MKTPATRTRRTLLIAAAIVVVLVAGFLTITYGPLLFVTPAPTGTPSMADQFSTYETKVAKPPTTAGIKSVYQLADYHPGTGSNKSLPLDSTLYTSCTTLRGATPTPQVTATPTEAETAVATTAANAAASSPDFVVFNMSGDESEACYAVGEILFDKNNQFNLAVGVTNGINGQVLVVRNNVANSKIGEIDIQIDQFKSDVGMRDNFIRRNFLQSDKYPIAKLTNATTTGLPARPYQDGEKLSFQITGTLEVHATPQQITFDATATLTGSTLVVTATANVKMSQFGFKAPEIGGMLKANDDAQLILNLVLHSADASGAAATAAQ